MVEGGHMSSATVGINLGIFTGTIEWDLVDHDRQCLIRVLRKLPSHEALYKPLLGEYAGEVVDSIQRLEQFLVEESLKLPEGSKVEKTLNVLAGFCRGFLGRAKEISQAIIHYVNRFTRNAKSGIEIPSDWKEIIEHYEQVGGPDLMTNKRLNIMDIQPPGYQHQFLQALGQLRGSFGTVLSIICPLSHLEIPDEVQRMIEYAPQPRTDPALVGESDRVSGDEFRRLATEWKSQSEFLASPSAIAGLPAYQAIIEMGQAAVPLILGELRREPDHWFVALKRITGADPVPADARGDIDRMAEAWLNWSRGHGIES